MCGISKNADWSRGGRDTSFHRLIKQETGTTTPRSPPHISTNVATITLATHQMDYEQKHTCAFARRSKAFSAASAMHSRISSASVVKCAPSTNAIRYFSPAFVQADGNNKYHK